MKLVQLFFSIIILANICCIASEADISSSDDEGPRRVFVRVHTPKEKFSPTLVSILAPNRCVTVAALKKAVSKKLDDPNIMGQRFTFCGKELDDQATISTYGLHSCQAPEKPTLVG